MQSQPASLTTSQIYDEYLAFCDETDSEIEGEVAVEVAFKVESESNIKTETKTIDTPDWFLRPQNAPPRRTHFPLQRRRAVSHGCRSSELPCPTEVNCYRCRIMHQNSPSDGHSHSYGRRHGNDREHGGDHKRSSSCPSNLNSRLPLPSTFPLVSVSSSPKRSVGHRFHQQQQHQQRVWNSSSGQKDKVEVDRRYLVVPPRRPVPIDVRYIPSRPAPHPPAPPPPPPKDTISTTTTPSSTKLPTISTFNTSTHIRSYSSSQPRPQVKGHRRTSSNVEGKSLTQLVATTITTTNTILAIQVLNSEDIPNTIDTTDTIFTIDTPNKNNTTKTIAQNRASNDNETTDTFKIPIPTTDTFKIPIPTTEEIVPDSTNTTDIDDSDSIYSNATDDTITQSSTQTGLESGTKKHVHTQIRSRSHSRYHPNPDLQHHPYLRLRFPFNRFINGSGSEDSHDEYSDGLDRHDGEYNLEHGFDEGYIGVLRSRSKSEPNLSSIMTVYRAFS